MYPASFAYLVPRSIQETLDLLSQHGDDAKLLAGGHSLIPAMKLYRAIISKYGKGANAKDVNHVYGMAVAYETVKLLKASRES